MGYEKHKRPLTAPSFTPNPTGILLADLAQGSDGQLVIAQSSAASAYKTVSGDLTIDKDGVATIGAGKATSSKIDPQVIQFASVALSAANLIAMNGAPVSVLAAPGAGKVIVVEQIILEMTRTSTAFTGGGAVSFQYHTTTSSVPHAGSIAATVVTTGGAGTAVVALGPNVGTNGLVIPANEGIDVTNASAGFAAGTGTANVFIAYRIITLI